MKSCAYCGKQLALPFLTVDDQPFCGWECYGKKCHTPVPQNLDTRLFGETPHYPDEYDFTRGDR